MNCVHCGKFNRIENYASSSSLSRYTSTQKKCRKLAQSDTFEMAVKRGDHRKALRTIHHREPNKNYIKYAANSLSIPTIRVCLECGDIFTSNDVIDALENVLTKKNSIRKTEMIEYLLDGYSDQIVRNSKVYERDLLLFSVKDLLTLKLLVEKYGFNINVLNSKGQNLLMYFISNINDEVHFPSLKSMISFILERGIDLNYIDRNKNLGYKNCGSNGYLHYLFEYSTHPPHYSLFKNYYRGLHFKHHNDGGFPLIKLFKKSCTENILSILNILLDLEYDIVDFTIIDTRIGPDNYNKNILTIFQWIGCSDKKSVLEVIDKLISRGVDPYHIYHDGSSHRMIDILQFFIREHIEESTLSIKEPSEE